jgi:hypothetical protein
MILIKAIKVLLLVSFSVEECDFHLIRLPPKLQQCIKNPERSRGAVFKKSSEVEILIAVDRVIIIDSVSTHLSIYLK